MGVLRLKDNPLSDTFFFCGGHFSLYMQKTYHIPSSVGILAPKLHTSALAAILYTLMTQNRTQPLMSLQQSQH